jgi:RNA polymerase sigma-70 factor (ECF subfamily)
MLRRCASRHPTVALPDIAFARAAIPLVMDARAGRSTPVTAVMSAPQDTAAAALDFDALYRAARDDVFAYVATLLRDRGAAEDVTAQAFERAFRRSRSYDARRGGPRAWLFGIARNAALDELRRRKRSAALVAEPADVSAPAPDDDAERAVERAAVRAALATLPAREREVIALKFHAGLDNAELADVLGTSVSNAGTLLHRAMTKLREAVDDRA